MRMGTPLPSEGKYRVIAPLGRGGMARVQLALEVGPAGLWKLVALKELRPELAADAAFVGMFFDEARLAVRLHHPNVVQTFGVETGEGRQRIVMEYLEGQTLGALLARVGGGGLRPAWHVGLLLDVLSGLQYAHELCDLDGRPLGLVHRDVSPQNVLVTYDGHIKLLDFGIAKAADNRQLTLAGTLKGKVAYMAPEQAAAGLGGKVGPIDRRADVFAVGVMLWEALVGRRFGEGQSEVQILSARLLGPGPSVLELRPDADPALAAVCDRAMAHDPAQRYPTASAFFEALEASLGGGPGVSSRASSGRSWRGPSTRSGSGCGPASASTSRRSKNGRAGRPPRCPTGPRPPPTATARRRPRRRGGPGQGGASGAPC
jgi:serine/threonine protein kinase